MILSRAAAHQCPRRGVGIVGFGEIGKYLLDQILTSENAHMSELAFVWNRSFAKVNNYIYIYKRRVIYI